MVQTNSLWNNHAGSSKAMCPVMVQNNSLWNNHAGSSKAVCPVVAIDPVGLAIISSKHILLKPESSMRLLTAPRWWEGMHPPRLHDQVRSSLWIRSLYVHDCVSEELYISWGRQLFHIQVFRNSSALCCGWQRSIHIRWVVVTQGQAGTVWHIVLSQINELFGPHDLSTRSHILQMFSIEICSNYSAPSFSGCSTADLLFLSCHTQTTTFSARRVAWIWWMCMMLQVYDVAIVL